eukprot:m.183433 g.183433  ORF g.183433 m.183433 type:complete len:139 (+) comp15544_c0_seq5:533-949(+)
MVMLESNHKQEMEDGDLPKGNQDFIYTRTTSNPFRRYLRICLTIEEGRNRITDLTLLKTIINKALRDLFGQVGTAVNVDILGVHKDKDGSVLIRTNKEDEVKVHAALTMLTKYDNRDCKCLMLASSPYLLHLASSSRT